MLNPNCPECRGTGLYTGSLFGGVERCSLCKPVDFNINPAGVVKGCFISTQPSLEQLDGAKIGQAIRREIKRGNLPRQRFVPRENDFQVSSGTDDIQNFVEENDASCRNRQGLCLQGYIADGFLHSVLRLYSERFPMLRLENPGHHHDLIVVQPATQFKPVHEPIDIMAPINDNRTNLRRRGWCLQFSRLEPRKDIWQSFTSQALFFLERCKEAAIDKTAYLGTMFRDGSNLDIRQRTSGPITVEWISDTSDSMVLHFCLYEKING